MCPPVLGGIIAGMIRFLILSLLVLTPTVARADYFLWKDPKSGLTISFPDTWEVVHNQKPDEVITVIGSSVHDNPVCKVAVNDDKRFVIFPAEYGRDVQKVAVSAPFWDKYLAQYEGYNLDRVYDGAGLGRWHASYALASYTTHSGTVLQVRRGIMFASLYNDKLYTLECSSLNHAYEAWAPAFKDIIKSVDFKKAYHEFPTGEYANFLKGADQYFWSQSAPDGTVAY